MNDRLSRRKALAILGLAGAGAGGFYVHEEGYIPIEDLLPGESGRETPAEPAYHVLQQEINKREENVSEPDPRVQFEYGSVEVEKVENAPFTAVSAETNTEETGDILEISTGDVRGDTLATMFRAVWRVEPNISVSATVSGEQIQFTGDKRKNYAVLLGVDSAASPERVLAARGESIEIAEDLVEQFE